MNLVVGNWIFSKEEKIKILNYGESWNLEIKQIVESECLYYGEPGKVEHIK